MKTIKIKYCFCAIVLNVFAAFQSCALAQDWDTYSDTWVAVDALGRKVISADEEQYAEKRKEDPSVGIFYYLWHGHHNEKGRPVFDITKLLQEKGDSIRWGDMIEMHWWGEPVLGYYHGGDPFIIAKHLQMICDAGIDFLFFDATNAFIYESDVEVVMREIDRRQSLGLRTPKLCFMVHAHACNTAERIYNYFYKKPDNDKYWYMYQGKPLMLGDKAEISQTKEEGLVDRFTFRNSWAWMQGKNEDEWPWLENYPQAPGWSGTKDNVEQIVVSTAQHATTKIGKSYHNGKEPELNEYAVCDSTSYGLFFEEQWKQAHQIQAPVLMITQWNEWIASRFPVNTPAEYWTTRPGVEPRVGECSFVDTYNAEFNRDIEPCCDPILKDNYYMQMCSNVRKYKGVRSIPTPKRKYTIKIDGKMNQWNKVSLEFRDDRGDILHQDTKGFNDVVPNVNNTGRNDFVRAKVAQDGKKFYFYIETMKAITAMPMANTDPWMTLLLNTDEDYSTGWEGYDYCVKIEANNNLALYRSVSNKYEWERVTEVEFRLEDNKLHLAIPSKLLGVKGNIDFKWTDNIPENIDTDALEFIRYGDVAPNSRFNYRYKASALDRKR